MENSNEEEVMEQLIALGYIDPGAGSPLWQIALAKIFGVSCAITSGVKKLFGAQRATKDED